MYTKENSNSFHFSLFRPLFCRLHTAVGSDLNHVNGIIPRDSDLLIARGILESLSVFGMY